MRPSPDLDGLLPSWLRHLAAERRSPRTVKLYATGVRLYLEWCTEKRMDPVLGRGQVQAFTADLLEQGREPETARAYQKAVRQYAKWLHAEGELEADPLLGIRPPKIDRKVTPVLGADQLHKLVRACDGKTLRDRRDEALIRLMVETGLRAGEAVDLQLGDVDLDAGLLVVRRGKGGKGRVVPFGPQTVRALDRYIRLRRQHPLAATPALWLGEGGRGFTYAGLFRALARRATAAGIPNFHPHVLRHTAAARWLAKGGSEGGLMAVAGWSRREMLDRYVAATRADLAAQEARGLELDEL
jgi:integrase/recombinase XerD